jgi:hypothetical protein
MKRISQKGQESRRKKAEAYAKFEEANDMICKGCGKYGPGSRSHLIPISEDKSLESVLENIVWHCIPCHQKFESHNIEIMKTMLDFEKNMEYIKRMKPLYYERLIYVK